MSESIYLSRGDLYATSLLLIADALLVIKATILIVIQMVMGIKKAENSSASQSVIVPTLYSTLFILRVADAGFSHKCIDLNIC